jgi:hypothetical protein
MPLPFLPNVQAPTTYPLSGLTDATLAFSRIANRLAWMEFDAGFIENGEIVDRGSYEKFAVSGSLTGGANAVTSGDGYERGGAVFDGTQSINLGSIMPTSEDFTIFAVYKQAANAQSANGIVGGSGASFYGLSLTPSNGRIALFAAGGAIYSGTVDHTLGTLMRLGVFRTSGGAFTIQVNGANEATGTSALVNADPTFFIGDIPGLSGLRNFVGTLYHLSLFEGSLTGDDKTAANAYIEEQYAP